MTPNTEEYLRGFLPLCFLHSMDEASEDALADVLANSILNIASEVCDVERCAAPDENLVMGYAADLAGGICRRSTGVGVTWKRKSATVSMTTLTDARRRANDD